MKHITHLFRFSSPPPSQDLLNNNNIKIRSSRFSVINLLLLSLIYVTPPLLPSSHLFLRSLTFELKTLPLFCWFQELKTMALADFSSSSSSSSELHVLAVDDSFVDRKVIERLLKISACKGKRLSRFCFSFVWFLFRFLDKFCGFVYIVTTVESGTRALQYLGLDGDKGSSGLKVLKLFRILTIETCNVLMLVWLPRNLRFNNKDQKFLTFVFI